MDEKKPGTGLATRSFTLMPASLGEAKELAGIIADSDFCPTAYKGKPTNIILAIQMGADLGLKPMQSLQNLAVINGRPSIYGDAALALAMPVLDRFKESLDGEGDEMVATCILRRKGWPDETIRTFSVKDARAAGLWSKGGPWTNYPKRMLQMRARGFAIRDACADLLLGLVLSEEAQDYPDAIDTHAVSVEEGRNAPVDLMERIPEALRDNVEKAFTTLSLAPGLRLAKLNEFLGKEGVTPEEGATALLEWCKDEYSKRKTGQPRKASNNKVKAAESKPAEPKPETAPPTVQDAEIVEPKPTTPAPPASSEIAWGNQGQQKPNSELF